MNVEYRNISKCELNRELFAHFIRRQVVDKCRRFVDGEWVIREDPFIDDWSEADYDVLVACLKNTVDTGGMVKGAFIDGVLKGFVSVEAEPIGDRGQYLDLTSIHVSQDCRGNGIGRGLFAAAKRFALSKGAEKLYISSHSAIESQAFYSAMGCVDAVWICREHVDKEPFDCQLECRVD